MESNLATLRQGRRLFAAAAALGLVLTLAACGDDDDDASSDAGTDTGTDDGASSADATLEIDSNAYTDVSATAGGTLEIVNNSGASHTFTADDGAFDESIGGGETVEVSVPDDAGDYPFHCEIHPSMTATLTVS